MSCEGKISVGVASPKVRTFSVRFFPALDCHRGIWLREQHSKVSNSATESTFINRYFAEETSWRA